MDTEQELTSVREQLLNAGLAELEAHGVGDFPCGVSRRRATSPAPHPTAISRIRKR